ncbi:MAG: EamA family transporter [Pseudomonadota bacterium]
MAGRLSAFDIMLGLCVPLVWGMGIVFAKGAIDYFPPILLMAMRFAVTALALVWFVQPPVGQMVKIFIIAFISAAIQYSLTFTGLTEIDASVAALIIQLEVPFLVLIGAIFLHERTGMRKWIGIAVSFVGVGMIAGEPKLSTAWVSLLMVVGGAFAWAVGQALVRKLNDISAMTVTAWIAVFATPQLLVFSFVFENGQIAAIESANWVVWSAVLYMGLIMTVCGYGMWYSLVRRHPVSLVAPFLLLLPVFSVAGGVMFLDERLTTQVMIGGIVVIAGVAFILIERRKPQSIAAE